MVLEFCKWDPQVGDVSTIAPFPLLMQRNEWTVLARLAEQLAHELTELEIAVRDRRELQAALGIPATLLRVIARCNKENFARTAPRAMRFDFHPTVNGWRISEANSDVPGGYSEASALPLLMKEHYPETTVAGDPSSTYADALERVGRTVALLSAPGFMEDYQVVANLCRLLRQRGCQAHLIQPKHLRWNRDRPLLETPWYRGPVDVVVRFYQAEWLPKLPRSIQWEPLLDCCVPVVNPGIAVLGESKRLPLIWDRLTLSLPLWRQLLPETRDPRDAPWISDEQWLIKTAFCNNGDTVVLRESTEKLEWLRTRIDVLLHPRHWVAQRRFETITVETPLGRMFPCIGVYVINGRACGIYGRLSSQPVVKYDAVDTAVLLEDSDDA